MTQGVLVRRLCQGVIAAGLFISLGFPCLLDGEAWAGSTFISPTEADATPALPTTRTIGTPAHHPTLPAQDPTPTQDLLLSTATSDEPPLWRTPDISTPSPDLPSTTSDGLPSTHPAQTSTQSQTPSALISPPGTASTSSLLLPTVSESPSPPHHTPTSSLTVPTNQATQLSFSTATSTTTNSPDSTPTQAAPPHPTPTPSSTRTPSPDTPPEYPEYTVLINEVAWAGTIASSSDEWIELLNNSGTTLRLDGWRLTDKDDISIQLRGSVPPHSYFLLERTDDQTIRDVPADQIYTGSLRNSGETLWLHAPDGAVIDSSNQDGGSWPGGSSDPRYSMERHGGGDASGNWRTFSGWGGNGTDAAGNRIGGTPKSVNSSNLPSPTASSGPDITIPPEFPPYAVLINEVAWAGTDASSSDEWIELMNTQTYPIHLEGWRLVDGGDIHIHLSGILPPHGYFLLERSNDTSVSNVVADLVYTGSLKNSGERLEILDPHGNVIDSADGSSGWPAGDSSTRTSMERRGGDDSAGNWDDYIGWGGSGLDAMGDPVRGTPRGLNSLFFPSPTPSEVPGSLPQYEPGVVLINEIAWAGTTASSGDEWIELMNTTDFELDLTGWILTDTFDLRATLSGSLASNSFFLLERSDDMTIRDIQANLIYSGSLRNTGETLYLLDPSGREIDSANLNGGGWPAGDERSRKSMERRGGTDTTGNWGTFTGYHGVGVDAAGNSIHGTPGRPNSILLPTPVPTWIPGRVVINEILIRPHYDWEGKGGVDTKDEFIELYNRGPRPVNIRGWWLDDIGDGGSRPMDLPSVTIDPGGFAVFFRSWTHIALNDTGDSVRLLTPDFVTIDEVSYLKVRAYNLSYGRLPDGSRHLGYGLWPTPGQPNLLFDETSMSSKSTQDSCALEAPPTILVSRLGRSPGLSSWMSSLDLITCRQPTLGLVQGDQSTVAVTFLPNFRDGGKSERRSLPP